jgi:hypothetical protein
MSEQTSSLSCYCDNGSFLPILSSTLGQLQTPALQITVGSRWINSPGLERQLGSSLDPATRADGLT